jgi:ribosomal protein S18 acetylase RimI-like enzyme
LNPGLHILLLLLIIHGVTILKFHEAHRSDDSSLSWTVLLIHAVLAIVFRMGKKLPASFSSDSIRIRPATAADVPALVEILKAVAAERGLSSIDVSWTDDEERTYLDSLTLREAIHVAVSGSDEIVGFQSLDLWTRIVTSMAHVAQLGTFLLPNWRKRGIGRMLFQSSIKFARDRAYSKIAIQVRASNDTAQRFYRQLGFRACGRLKRQVRIDGVEDDQMLMEFFL